MARNPLAAEVTADVSDFLSGIAAAKGQAEEFGDAAATAARKVDDLGDEAGGATGGVSRLGAASGVAATSVGSLGASAATAAVGVGGLAAVATPLAATLGGVATAGAALAGVFGALGLATVATEGEALSEALAGVKDGILDAIEPIGDTFAPILVDLIQRLPNVARAVVTALGPLDPFARAVRDAGNALLNVLPAIARFAGNLAREALPVLRRLVRVTAEVVPPAIRTMLEVTRTLGGSLLDLAKAASGLIGPLLDIGTVGEDGNSGVLNTALREYATFLQNNATTLVRTGFRSVARVAKSVARNLSIALVGESGSGGLLNNIIGQFTDFARVQGPKLARTAFEAVGSAIRGVAIELFNAVTGNSDSILRSIIKDFGRYLVTDAPGDLLTAINIAFDVIVAAAEGLYEGLVGNSTLLDIINDFAAFLRNEAPGKLTAAAETAFDALVSTIEATLQADGDFFLLAAFKDGFDAVVSRVSNLQSRLSNAFTDVAEAIGEALSGISIDFPEPPSWLQEAAQAISGGLSTALHGDDSDDGGGGGGGDDGDDGGGGGGGDDGDDGGGGDDPPPPPGGPVNPSPGAASSLSAGVTAPSPDASTQTTTPAGTSTAELSRAVERGMQRADRTDDLLREQRRTKRAISQLAEEVDRLERQTQSGEGNFDPASGL